MKPLFFLLALAVWQMGQAQNATIALRDSVKLKTELVFLSGDFLKTKAGTLGLGEIYSIKFENAQESGKQPEMLHKLLATDILIYVGNELIPSEKPVTSPMKSKDFLSPSSSKAAHNPGHFEEGFGFGIDYGGFGARFIYLPDPHVGIFAGGGYAITGFGYNIGIMARAQPQKKVMPTFSFMYGYNTAITVRGLSGYNKLYYGPSVGLGFMSKSRRNEETYWHFQLIIPFRSSEFDRDYNFLKSNPNISIPSPPPVLVSIGYNFGFK